MPVKENSNQKKGNQDDDYVIEDAPASFFMGENLNNQDLVDNEISKKIYYYVREHNILSISQLMNENEFDSSARSPRMYITVKLLYKAVESIIIPMNFVMYPSLLKFGF